MLIIAANLKTPKLSPAAQKAEEKKLAEELTALRNKLLVLPSQPDNLFFGEKLTRSQMNSDNRKQLIKKIANAKTIEERAIEIKLEYFRTINLFRNNEIENLGENLTLELYVENCMAYEFNKLKQETFQLIETAQSELKEKKLKIVEFRIKEIKEVFKTLNQPAKLKEKMTKDFEEALTKIDDNGDKAISAREFNEYQVRTFLKLVVKDALKTESERSKTWKAVENKIKEEITDQQREAFKSDDEETEALQDFKTESEDPS